MVRATLLACQPCNKHLRMSKIVDMEFGLRPSFGVRVRGDESHEHREEVRNRYRYRRVEPKFVANRDAALTHLYQRDSVDEETETLKE